MRRISVSLPAGVTASVSAMSPAVLLPITSRPAVIRSSSASDSSSVSAVLSSVEPRLISRPAPYGCSVTVALPASTEPTGRSILSAVRLTPASPMTALRMSSVWSAPPALSATVDVPASTARRMLRSPVMVASEIAPLLV